MGSHFIGARRSDLFKVLDRSILGRNWGRTQRAPGIPRRGRPAAAVRDRRVMLGSSLDDYFVDSVQRIECFANEVGQTASFFHAGFIITKIDGDFVCVGLSP